MIMRVPNQTEHALWLGAVLVAVLVLGQYAAGQATKRPDIHGAPVAQSANSPGDPSSVPTTQESRKGKANAQQPSRGTAPASRPPFDPELPANLGDPLVDEPNNLRRLDPSSPVWINKKDREVVLIGSVCRANYPLEFFATYPDRGYESVVVVYTKPSVVHAGLLALGGKPGKAARYKPKFVAASGTEVEIGISWKDQSGKRQKVRAQDWIRDIKTRKSPDMNWVFAGSVFWEDKSTGAKSYLADRGDFISVTSLPTAMLDLPIESDTAMDSRSFEGFAERLPAPGTPVTLILKPKLVSTRD
jgi:hypothetical protein